MEIVKAALAAYPVAINLPGPHGISLIAHAQAGGNKAVPVGEYLQSLSSQSTKDRVV